MQAASLEILEKANVPAPQARAIVQAIGIEIEGARDTLATKQDLLLLRHEMTELGAGLRTEMANMRSDLRTEMHALASANVRQLYLALLGQMAVLLGIAYFFVEHLPR